MSDSGLTPGDPLHPGPETPRHESGPPGYTSPPPPGAFGTAPSAGELQAAPSTGRYALAGWWSRVGATLIDGVIVGAGATLILLLFGSVFSVGFFASDEAGIVSLIVGLMLACLAIAIVALFYAPLMMARTNGRTVGRMAMGIRVIRANGQPMTFGFAMLREVVIKALLFGVIGSITIGVATIVDVLWPLWDEENRALHDYLVNTRVVRD
jgi:uncharacterized RDD family membrane protein YckC